MTSMHPVYAGYQDYIRLNPQGAPSRWAEENVALGGRIEDALFRENDIFDGERELAVVTRIELAQRLAHIRAS